MSAIEMPVTVTVTYNSPPTPAEFTQWLRGFLDASPGGLTHAQVELVRKRLEDVRVPQPIQLPYSGVFPGPLTWPEHGPEVTW